MFLPHQQVLYPSKNISSFGPFPLLSVIFILFCSSSRYHASSLIIVLYIWFCCSSSCLQFVFVEWILNYLYCCIPKLVHLVRCHNSVINWFLCFLLFPEGMYLILFPFNSSLISTAAISELGVTDFNYSLLLSFNTFSSA